MMSEVDAYNELCGYTHAHGDEEFIHQYVVDAFAAQDASPSDKPIRLAFALVGLYLHAERGFTGREVQLAHMVLARKKQTWPTFDLPENRGSITATAVLAAPRGERDELIRAWVRSTWEAYADQHNKVVALLDENGVTDRWSVLQRRRSSRA